MASEIDMPFEQAGDYGLLGEVMEDDEYTAITGLEYEEPEEPGNYDEDITDVMEDHERKRLEAAHNSYRTPRGVAYEKRRPPRNM